MSFNNNLTDVRLSFGVGWHSLLACAPARYCLSRLVIAAAVSGQKDFRFF